jgi:hypothetical protein
MTGEGIFISEFKQFFILKQILFYDVANTNSNKFA